MVNQLVIVKVFKTKTIGRIVLQWSSRTFSVLVLTEPYCCTFNGGCTGIYGQPDWPVEYNAMKPLFDLAW